MSKGVREGEKWAKEGEVREGERNWVFSSCFRSVGHFYLPCVSLTSFVRINFLVLSSRKPANTNSAVWRYFSCAKIHFSGTVDWDGVQSRDLNPITAAKFNSLHRHIQTVHWAHPSSCPNGTVRSFPEGKAAGAWSFDSSAVGVKFKNARNVNSVPTYAIIQSAFAQCIHFVSLIISISI
jgi:hypothetical protein